MRWAFFALCVLLVLTACGSTSLPTTSRGPNPIATSTAPLTFTATAMPTPGPTILAFPSVSESALTPGRYDSSPPFEVDFTFEIFEPGWYSAHIHGEFFDVMRFDGSDARAPTRWLAWAIPQTIHGDRDVPAAELTAEQAADLMAKQIAVEAGPLRDFAFAGLQGVQADYHTDIGQVPLFGGGGDNFQLDSSQDARIGIVALDDELLFVMCLAPSDELDAACEEIQPILDSVDL